MNQRIADAVRALPAPLQDPLLLGWIWLLLCYLAYRFCIRAALWRQIRALISEREIDRCCPTVFDRLLFTPLANKAQIAQNGYYILNRVLFPALLLATLLHSLAGVLVLTSPTLHTAVRALDCGVLSLLFFAVAVPTLISQPRATIERRTRWGFRPLGNVVHAVLWEFIILFALFFWLYVAYFLALL